MEFLLKLLLLLCDLACWLCAKREGAVARLSAHRAISSYRSLSKK